MAPSARTPGTLEPILPVSTDGTPALTIVMPWFRKLAEFERVLRMNRRYFARPGIELVLALDEASEETALLSLLRAHPDIACTVVVNDRAHPWRPPCRAINVGIRLARAPFVLVVSPESAFVGDLPARALRAVRAHPGGIALGRVAFSRFDELARAGSLAARFAQAAPERPAGSAFYGSMCAPRAALESVGGYDETLARWGGDDDNLRVRLEMAGYGLHACEAMRVLHLSFEARTGGEQFDPEHEFACCSPMSAIANADAQWGRDFARIACAHAPDRASAPVSTQPAPAPSTAATTPLASARRCPWCARRLHTQSPRIACGCAPWIRGTGRAPRVAALMQVRNEARALPGCIEHLRGHVDGVIALDDGSTDGTQAILAGDPLVIDLIANPVVDPHTWNEVENQRRLLEHGRAHGFDWVLCVDADERFELALLQRLRDLAATLPSDRPACVDFAFRELWDSPVRYRTDGVWGGKRRARFFPVPETITFAPRTGLHGQWYPEEIRTRARMVRLRYNIYHMKSITRADRIARRDFYQALDPDNRHQAIGYGYLAREDASMTLERIGPGREYALETLPADLLGLLEAGFSPPAARGS